MSAIGEAIKSIESGASELLKGVGNAAKGLLNLNPKEMASGAMQAAGGVLSLTPECLEASAANNLLDGAISSLGGSNGGTGNASPW